MKVALALSLTLLVADPMPSGSPALRDLEARMTPLYRAYGTANLTSLCGLRSPEWFRSLSLSLWATLMANIQAAHLSAPDANALAVYAQATSAAAAARYTCRSLFNSPEIARLDAMQWKASGGYH